MIVWTSLSPHEKTRVNFVELYGSYSNSRKAAYTSERAMEPKPREKPLYCFPAADSASSFQLPLPAAPFRHFGGGGRGRGTHQKFDALSLLSLPLSSLPPSLSPLSLIPLSPFSFLCMLAFHFPELISQRELKISKSATIKRF